jgi:hypothetical protein
MWRFPKAFGCLRRKNGTQTRRRASRVSSYDVASEYQTGFRVMIAHSLDTEMLIRVFFGWLRGEPRHYKMIAIPTLGEENARCPSRERESLIGETH